MAEHFLQVKSLIDLMPGDERISITYDKKSEDWKITGDNKNGIALGVYTILKISDDLPYALNTCMSDVVTVLVSHYNKLYKTQFTSYREIMAHKGETSIRREYLTTISSQAREIEELKKAIADANPPKDVIVVEHEKSDGRIVEEHTRSKPTRKYDKTGKYKGVNNKGIYKQTKVKTLTAKQQLKLFKDWEKDNPTKSNRGVKTYDVLKELIALGVTDITIFVTWRIAIYNSISFPKGKMSKRDKDLYKKAHDRVYHRCYYTPAGLGKIKDEKMREKNTAKGSAPWILLD